MSARRTGWKGPPREHELDVVCLDTELVLDDGRTVRPILTVVSDRRTRMVVEAILSVPSKDGPAAG